MMSCRTNQARQYGFTIVELLIVIVVIGILAAISIVAYSGIQQRAHGSAAVTALNQASKKLSLYQVTNSSFPATGSLSLAGVSDSGDVAYQYKTTTSGYCVTATSGSVSYRITESSAPTAGACTGHGNAGVAAISNLIANPSYETALTGINAGNYAGSVWGLSRPTTGGQSGSSYARGLSQANATAIGGGLILDLPDFKDGIAQNVQFQVRSSKATRITARIWCYSSTTPGDGFLGSSNDRLITDGTVLVANQWTKISAMVTPPTGSVTGRIILQGAGGTGQYLWQNGDTFDIDSLFVAVGAVDYTYADGDSPGWDWNGSAAMSTSSGVPL